MKQIRTIVQPFTLIRQIRTIVHPFKFVKQIRTSVPPSFLNKQLLLFVFTVQAVFNNNASFILQEVKELVKHYPTDEELCVGFLQKSRWDNFKQGVVESVVVKQHGQVGFSNTLKHCSSSQYTRKCEINQMTSHFYTPLTSDSHSPLIGSYKLTPKESQNIATRGMRNVIG